MKELLPELNKIGNKLSEALLLFMEAEEKYSQFLDELNFAKKIIVIERKDNGNLPAKA